MTLGLIDVAGRILTTKRYVLAFASLWLGLIPFISLAEAVRLPNVVYRSCSTVESAYAHYTSHESGLERVTMVVSSQMMKTLNDNAFASRTAKTQFLVELAHFFFQYRLFTELENKNDFVKLISRKSPISKFITLQFNAPGDGIDAMLETVAFAKSSAMKDLADYFFAEDPSQLEAIANSVVGPNSENGRTLKYGFAEDRSFIIPLADGDRADFKDKVRAFFGTRDQFIASFGNTYGVGVAANDSDAHYAARLATLNRGSTYTNAVVHFNLAELRKHVRHALSEKQELRKIFQVKGDAERLELFTQIRENLNVDDPAKWSPQFRKILMRQAGTKADDFALANVAFELRRYFTNLNLLDYLPDEAVAVDPNARATFQSITTPNNVVFFDIRGAGARNMVKLHDLVEPLAKELTELEDRFLLLRDLEISGAMGDEITVQTNAISASYARLAQMRRDVFAETGKFISEKKEQLVAAIKRAGVKDNQLGFWTTGDEGFVVTNGTASGQQIASAIKMDPELSRTFRVAYMPLADRKLRFLSLEFARYTVGRAADALKFAEKLDLGYEVVAEFRSDGHRDFVFFAKVDPATKTLQPIPAKDMDYLRAGLGDEWVVKNYTPK